MQQSNKLQLHSEQLVKDSPDKKQDQQSKWKSKSLNSLPTQHYEMDIAKSLQPKKIQTKQTQKKPKQPQKQGKKSNQTNQKVLPAPKIKKINEKTFCITIDNQINIFYLLDNNQKIKQKTKKSFGMIKHQIGSNIQFAAGNNSNYIFLGTLTELIIIDLYKKQDKYFIKEVCRKQIPNLRAVTFMASQLIAVSSDQVYQYNVTNFDLVAKKSIQFEKQLDKTLFKTLKPVGLVVQSIFCFYFFGTITQQKVDYNAKKKYAVQGPPPSKQCEVLHIVKFKIQQNLEITHMQAGNDQIKKSKMMSMTQLAESRIISIKIQIFPIDHVFQTGIFQKSKIFQIDESVFLMSLHQQIILIKKHFNKFIVWDNVSIVSSKSQQKKGQLVLADKRILVYSQNGQIFAHDIFFNQEESRINMPPIDGFRGNDNDQQILYDAVLLEYDKQSLMKVLFYFKQIDIILPNKSKFRKQPQNPTEVHDQNSLHFTMLCINQSDPKQKLKQLLRLKKQPNQIAQFCERFGINSLQKTKCMWSVSDKSLKDIENVLLQISDDKYIQTQLDNILKKEPHNLTFLISVQKKQIARLKKLLVRNMLNDSQTSQASIVYSIDGSGESARKKIQYAKKVIQWLMESIMFQKKLDYSKNFLSFKEYDFIQIGKLKAASLKQQIKLLSCKKYEKRLKYFLNSFKILAIANWEEIFRFLLINKNQKEIQQFLIEFGFILPKFYQISNVFQQKQQFDVGINRKAKQSKKQKTHEEKCILWDDLQEVQTLLEEAIMNAGEDKGKVSNESGQRPLNTIQDFQQMVIQNIKSFKKDKRQENEAIQNFKAILRQIVQSPWFSGAAFKQHSMLNKTSKQLKQQFYALKNKGAYKILIKYLYEQIQNANPSITISGINQMLVEFVSLGIIPQSFKRNDDARLQVYKILQKKSIQNPSKQFFVPKKSQYLIWKQDQYFSFLFKHIKEDILRTVKTKYQDVEGGFFRQRFQLYLKSTFVNLKGIINFLSQFDQSSSDDVRVDIFNCIKRLLKLGDYQNTRDFIEKSLQKQVLPEKSGQMQTSNDNLRQQAKIPYGFVFFHFFKVFNLDYTYEQLIQSTQNTNLHTNILLKQLIHKYCAGQIYKDTDYDNKEQCKITFEDHKIISQKLTQVDILDQPLQFFGVLLYMVSIIEFQVVEEDLFKFMLEEYLNQGRVDKIQQFITSIVEYTVNHESLNTKNYQLINEFKDSHIVQQIFVEYSLDWISRNYSRIKDPSNIEPTLKSISNVLLALSQFKQQKIHQQECLFSLLQFIKKFNSSLMMKIDFIKQELHHSGFIFLMHIFRQIGVDCFINCDPQEDQIQVNTSIKVSKNKHKNSNIMTKIYLFNLIFVKYKQIRKEESVGNQKQSEVDFTRFLVQLCCISIGQKKFEMAWQLLMKCAKNAYYFNDAFFYFVSQTKIQNVSEFKESLRIYLGASSANLLVQKLRQMIKSDQNNSVSRVLSFSQQKTSIFDLKGKQQQNQTNSDNYLFLFQELTQNNRIDEAYYFLIRIRYANMQQIQQKGRANRKYGQRFPAYTLLVVYFKALQKYISDEFYPTFLFFKSKFEILSDNLNRKDIIKDINIAISRLKQKQQEEDDKNQVVKRDIEECWKHLKKYYQQFMFTIHEDPVIKLTEEDEQLATKRIQSYARMNQDDRMFQQQSRQENQAKLRLQQNQLKMNQIHQKNKLNVVRKQVNQSISQARKNADKYAMMLEQKKKEENKISYAEKKEKEIEEIKRKETQDVASIKDSYKSTTTQKVNDLIQNLRKKRQNIGQHRAKNAAMREEVTQNVKQIPSKDHQYQNVPQPYKPTQNLPTSKYQAPVKAQNDNLMPVTIKPGMRANQIIQNLKKSNVLDRHTQKYYQKKQQATKFTSKHKITREEITQILKQHQPEAFKYMEKFDLIKSNFQIAVELVKRMFTTINNIQNFMQFIKYLLDLDPKYRQILEEKSLPVVAQMIKMGQKINLKELISSQLFIKVYPGMSTKDYYQMVYTTLRPNIMKILQKQEVTIHSLGILLRYSLGSDTRYFNKTVIDYIRVLLKSFSSKLYDDKEISLLSQKLRTQYLSMEEQSRQNNFEQLLNEIPNQNLKKKLVDALGRVNQKKSQSVLGGKQTQQFARIIKRLSK